VIQSRESMDAGSSDWGFIAWRWVLKVRVMAKVPVYSESPSLESKTFKMNSFFLQL
jgi:hypothetical protein